MNEWKLLIYQLEVSNGKWTTTFVAYSISMQCIAAKFQDHGHKEKWKSQGNQGLESNIWQ